MTRRNLMRTAAGAAIAATLPAQQSKIAQGKADYPKQIGSVELLGNSGPRPFTRGSSGLIVTLPRSKPNEYVYVLKTRAV